MELFFTRLKVGHPQPLKALQDFPDSWKVYTICIDQNVGSSTTWRDVGELEDWEKTHARTAYSTLLGKAQTGLPLSDQYDKKKCHDAHTFNIGTISVTLYRIRGGDVRIYFCYLPPSKTIVILKTWPKHKDKLSKSEKLELENIAKQVFQYLDPVVFSSRVI